jgi:putative thiamine transport system ATP-binding protein
MKREAEPRRETVAAESLQLRQVTISIAGRALFTPLDITVASGECVTLMGPSGSGKSTLLNFIAGTLDPAFNPSGSVSIGAKPLDGLPPERRRVGILFQDDLLFPHLSVGGNLAFALPAHLRGREVRRSRIESALIEAELPGFAERDPATLSGGQRARVALMRTLLAEPRALLLDEPFNRLDAQLRGDFRTFVIGHARERGLPILLVTHDEADAIAVGGRVIRLG